VTCLPLLEETRALIKDKLSLSWLGGRVFTLYLSWGSPYFNYQEWNSQPKDTVEMRVQKDWLASVGKEGIALVDNCFILCANPAARGGYNPPGDYEAWLVMAIVPRDRRLERSMSKRLFPKQRVCCVVRHGGSTHMGETVEEDMQRCLNDHDSRLGLGGRS
jgi:hypothetical protein